MIIKLLTNIKTNWPFYAAGLLFLLFAVIPFIILSNVDYSSAGITKNTFQAQYYAAVYSSCISFATIFILLITYRSQKKELEESRKLVKIQADTMRIQKFESTFFGMLSRLDTFVNNMVQLREKKFGEPNVTGRIFLRNFVEEFLQHYNGDKKIPNQTEVLSDDPYIAIPSSSDYNYWKKDILNTYEHSFNSESSNLGHYFRYLHNIIKYVLSEFGVDNIENIPDLIRNEIKKYFGILQSQLSNDELVIIFYNSLSTFSLNQEDKPQFKDWIDKFCILENIGERYVILPQFLDEFPDTNFWCKDKFEILK